MYTRNPYQALGGELSTKVAAGVAVARDPALNEVACLALQLNAITENRKPEPCPRKIYTEAQKTQGVGLHQLVGPLRTWIWIRQNPGATVAIGAAAIATVGIIGYSLRRRARRKRSAV